MSTVKTKYRLVGTERAALFKASSSRDFDQAGWGTKVRLSQVRDDAIKAEMTLILGNASEAKPFNDAEIGSEFEVTISPL